MSKKVVHQYASGIKGSVSQIFHGPIGSLRGYNYEPVIQTGSQFNDLMSVSGSGMEISFAQETIPNVHELKIVALDKNGKELKSFKVPAETELNLTVFLPDNSKVDRIRTVSGNISVHGIGKINTISSSNGGIVVESSESINSIKTTNGDVTVKSGAIGNIKTLTGKIVKQK